MLLFTTGGWSDKPKHFFHFYFQTWQRDTSLNIFESDPIFYLKRKKTLSDCDVNEAFKGTVENKIFIAGFSMVVVFYLLL